jgi:GDP-4-dehydro-6-deoxy-D-mannose reductase
MDPEKIRPVDIPIIKANTRKMKKEIGWRPNISLDESLSPILEYWRNFILAQKQ